MLETIQSWPTGVRIVICFLGVGLSWAAIWWVLQLVFGKEAVWGSGGSKGG